MYKVGKETDIYPSLDTDGCSPGMLTPSNKSSTQHGKLD